MQPGHPDQQVRLLEGPLHRHERAAPLDQVEGWITPNDGRRRDVEFPARCRQGGRHEGDEQVVVDGTRDGDDEVLRPVVGAVVLPHRFPGDRRDRLGIAADRPAQGMLTEDRLEEPLARDIRRVVVGHRELFEDDAPFALELPHRQFRATEPGHAGVGVFERKRRGTAQLAAGA